MPDQIIDKLVQDQSTGAGNFEQSWNDVYAYLYDPSVQGQTPAQRLAQLQNDINTYNNTPGVDDIVRPFTIDGQGNIEFAFTSEHATDQVNGTAYYTFSDGSKYTIMPNGNDYELTFNNTAVGNEQTFTWNGTNYVDRSTGDVATVDTSGGPTDGDLTITYAQGSSVTYRVNGDVVRSFHNDRGNRVTTEQPDGTMVTRDTYTDNTVVETTQYPNRFEVTRMFDANGDVTMMSLNNANAEIDGRSQMLLQRTANGWTDVSGNTVAAPIIDANNDTITMFTADGRSFVMDGQTMLFSAYSSPSAPGGVELVGRSALGVPQNWQVDFAPPVAAPIAPTATVAPPTLPGS